MNKRQKYKAGAIVKIELTDKRLVFGRLLPGVMSMINVYDFIGEDDLEKITIEDLVKKPVLFCCGLYRTIITKGIFEIIGNKEFTESEIAGIPPLFKQDIVNIDDCLIFWPTGGERKARPEECIGLEQSSVWSEKGLIERIEDYYSGKKNFNVEHQKVILSKNDPRYMPPNGMLRWDFEKREFYRTDIYR
jgi:hypothetical protein